MLLVTGSGKRFAVQVLPDVSFVEVNAPMVGALFAYWELCAELGVDGVVTGASRNPAYAKEPLHRRGFAWDLRSFIFDDREGAFRRLQVLLKEIDPRYRAVYIRPPKLEHYHVEWRNA